MPIFSFEAIDKNGKKILDIVEAGDLNSAIAKIRELSYFPIHIYEKTAKGKERKKATFSFPDPSVFLRHISTGVSLKQLTLFTRQMATLNGSGVPVLKSLNILKTQQRPGFFRDILDNLSKDVESGLSLSDALAKFPDVFSSLYVNMVKSGEIGGVLEIVLSRLADFHEKNQRLTNRVRAALIYPVFVVVIATLILVVLITFVVPKFMAIFSELGASLPAPTLILLTVSNLLRKFWLAIIFLFILGVISYRQLVKMPLIRYRIDVLKLHLPVFGFILSKIIIARFSRTFGTLIRSGVPILQALNISKDTSGNVVISNAIKKVHDSIREGDTISGPLSKSGVFPPVVVNMIDVGEETGQLDLMLLKISDTYEDEVESSILAITSLLEPFLIIVMGFIVGFIIISMLLPLISLINSISV